MSAIKLLILACVLLLTQSLYILTPRFKPRESEMYCDNNAQILTCPEEFEPVCALKPTYCIQDPCPQYQTFPNACVACQDSGVRFYIVGECPAELEFN